ncbi:hypothetical protein [Schaalia sp. ZJ1691]|uniref:hypothetical protein n=1 Tax=Schaalia sp. ZJ1691 TaxID=2709404 RepID=UPI0013EC0978|nr:hypothetical protein [Schaalia sp. ZJ1691]
MISVKKMAFVAAVAAVALGAGACSARPGTAAEINGTRYTDADVSYAAAQFTELTGKAASPSAIVAALPSIVALEEAAAQTDLSVSDEDVVKTVDEAIAAGNLKKATSELTPTTIMLLRNQLLVAQVRNSPAVDQIAEQFKQIAQQQDVTMNPRYGTVNQITRQLVPPTFGDVKSLQAFGSQANEMNPGDGADSDSGNSQSPETGE